MKIQQMVEQIKVQYPSANQLNEVLAGSKKDLADKLKSLEQAKTEYEERMRPWEEKNGFLRKESDALSREQIKTIDPDDADDDLQKSRELNDLKIDDGKVFKNIEKQLNVTTTNNQPARILHEMNLEYHTEENSANCEPQDETTESIERKIMATIMKFPKKDSPEITNEDMEKKLKEQIKQRDKEIKELRFKRSRLKSSLTI